MAKYLLLLFLIGSFSCDVKKEVVVSEAKDATGTDCFVITTPTATYFYQKESGGFSSILDKNETDWIQFKASDSVTVPKSADSDFRGLPNLVFRSEDGGVGHPGFDKVTSEFVAPNIIKSVSKSGKWAWHWNFYDDHAQLTVDKIDPDTPYWFLYEGPTAGSYDPKLSFWGNSVTGFERETPNIMKGETKYYNLQTAYFGKYDYDQVLFVHQVEPDEHVDHFAYMGNSKKGIEADDGMVVFGFGRAKGAQPLLDRKNTFLIGFYDKIGKGDALHGTIMNHVQQLVEEH